MQRIHRIGLDNFVAENQDDYVEKARHFAENTDYLRQLRENMRQRVEQSPLCDANAFAKNIERAFNFMWEACDQASPETDDHVSFDDAIKKSIGLFQANRPDELQLLAPESSSRSKSFEAIDVLAGTLLTQNKLQGSYWRHC